MFESFVSFDQSYHLAPLYWVKGVHNVVPIEHGKQTFNRSRRVSRARLNVFPQDAPSVLNGMNDRILVWIIHDGGTQLHGKPGFKIREEFSFPFGAAVLCLGG